MHYCAKLEPFIKVGYELVDSLIDTGDESVINNPRNDKNKSTKLVHVKQLPDYSKLLQPKFR